ncbi:MAG TPA: DUF4265 domain-containing protein [Nitrolancea sp.]|nr:DUF4265 domain-containing protein [Nitrolancea sp.]
MDEERAGNQGQQVKVVFPLDEGPAETMWADDVGGGIYRLDNVPIFAYDVGLGDVFVGKSVDGDERLYFDRVVERSGDYTFRIIVLEDQWLDRRAEVEENLSRVRKFSSAESSWGTDGFAFNVLGKRDIEELESVLEEGARRGLWEWELSAGPDQHLER